MVNESEAKECVEIRSLGADEAEKQECQGRTMLLVRIQHYLLQCIGDNNPLPATQTVTRTIPI